MARLCIRITPNNNPSDPSLDVMRTQLGDVVCIKEDGHVFSKGELDCGHYRIIDVPGVSAGALVSLTTSKFDATGAIMTALRSFTLDKTLLNSGAWKTRTIATKSQVDAITVVKV